MRQLIEVLQIIASQECRCTGQQAQGEDTSICQVCTAAIRLNDVAELLQAAVTEQLEWNERKDI